MESLVAKGLVKSIGVSNCTIPMMIDLLAYAEIKPVINQVEMHPYLNQAEVLRFHRKWGIVLEGYSPIGGEGGNVLDDAVLACPQWPGFTWRPCFVTVQEVRGHDTSLA